MNNAVVGQVLYMVHQNPYAANVQCGYIDGVQRCERMAEFGEVTFEDAGRGAGYYMVRAWCAQHFATLHLARGEYDPWKGGNE